MASIRNGPHLARPRRYPVGGVGARRRRRRGSGEACFNTDSGSGPACPRLGARVSSPATDCSASARSHRVIEMTPGMDVFDRLGFSRQVIRAVSPSEAEVLTGRRAGPLETVPTCAAFG
jgi:hypothetical protein